MIEACGLVKRYGSTTAVNDLSASVCLGRLEGYGWACCRRMVVCSA